MADDYALFRFEATRISGTEKAFLLEIDGEETWFPRSQLTYEGDGEEEGHGEGEVEWSIPYWLAKKRGMDE